MAKKLTKEQFKEWVMQEKVENHSGQKYVYAAFSAAAFTLIITSSSFATSRPNLSDEIELCIILSMLSMTVNVFLTFCYTNNKMLREFLYFIGHKKRQARLLIACGPMSMVIALFSFLYLVSGKVALFGYLKLLLFFVLSYLVRSCYRRGTEQYHWNRK
ncbi:hypothetical protein [Pseudoalteromonas sp. PPB1]|uniref:hypothetical protein n=1 Tax=Pseudoalteromonas sp. PPB1 TaxID=2756136 RepID=UPI001890CCFF|nr:hypothetical protein [Pseudoalteromonas sp. PPB1]